MSNQQEECPKCILCSHTVCCHMYGGKIGGCEHIECRCVEFIEYKEAKQ